MSLTLDPAKLKVVELRAELTKRGLDSKGNKPALVKRLKTALEKELQEEIPDTSIAETSTEDIDTSLIEEKSKEDLDAIEPGGGLEENEPLDKLEDEQADDCSVQDDPMDDKLEQETVESLSDQAIEESKPITQLESIEDETTQELEPLQVDETLSAAEEKSDVEILKNNELLKTPIIEKVVEDKSDKVEKRKHSLSPPRSQKRSKSPIQEDEPDIEPDQVLLSWYDADLNLQVDKKSFLSAKPYNDGAFGFAWAGIRATHGIGNGKACYEVKITEELKWDDFSKYSDRHRREATKSYSKPHVEKHGVEKLKESIEETNKDGTSEEAVKSDKILDVEMKESTKHSDEESTMKQSEPQKLEAVETENVEQIKEDKIDEKEPPEDLPSHMFRVGWSWSQTGLQLGENNFSYGYESSGKFVSNTTFQNYGIKFGVGDVVSTFLNIDEGGVKITYAVNGTSQNEAVFVPRSELPEDLVLFPHILSRNCAFELNLGGLQDSWFSKPSDFEDYKFISEVDDKTVGPSRPEKRSDCEVILMCGLPASGKTHWVKEYVESSPRKYTILGDSHLLEKMTVSGDTLRSKYQGSWTTLLEKLQKSVNKLIETAALRRRNYIIDQPNVFPSAQRRKLRLFEGFKRRAVVVVVGDEEQAKRQSLQEAEDGKTFPDTTIIDMKANMSLPQKEDWLDEVEYVGVTEDEAKTIVQKYNAQKRDSMGIQRRFSNRDDRQRWHNKRNDYRGGNYRDRNYYNRFDRSGRQGNWHPQRPGGWNRDRRDNRGPMAPSRDWRNRGGNGPERPNRELTSPGNNYNRNRSHSSRGSSGNWSTSWNQNPNTWDNNQSWSGQGSWAQGNWSGQNNQNQWKYGGGQQGYGNYSNWNYYGQYAQNWNPQASSNQFGQYSQQDWAQYAQQYAQQGQSTTSSSQSTPQK